MRKNAPKPSHATSAPRTVDTCSKPVAADRSARCAAAAAVPSAKTVASAGIGVGDPSAPGNVHDPVPAARTRSVLEALVSRWPGEGRTAARMLALARELLEELDAAKAGPWEPLTPQGQRIVTRWCWQACAHDGTHRRAAASTAAYRQRIARAVFEEAARLGASADPDAVVGEPIVPPSKLIRGLTDAEVLRLQALVEKAPEGSRQPLVVVLAIAGGTATAIAKVRVGDIDLGNATVTFAGSEARVAKLDDWGVRVVRRWLRDNSPVPADMPLCVSTRTTPEREVESVSCHLRRALRAAGLYELEGIATDSIRLNTARRVLDTDGIVAAARFLGWRSLDRVAEALGHNWRNPDG